jgi:tRNA threonylcarbamoyladenosine biosynthesis protein TsaE
MKRMDLQDEAGTEALGEALAAAWQGEAGVIYLSGPLGAGKTTLARALLRALGVTGTVRSPTYTLVEPYETERGAVTHLDLYRIAAAGELEFLGLRDLSGSLMLIEWPERGGEELPSADLIIALAHLESGAGRTAEIRAASPLGERLIGAIGDT